MTKKTFVVIIIIYFVIKKVNFFLDKKGYYNI